MQLTQPILLFESQRVIFAAHLHLSYLFDNFDTASVVYSDEMVRICICELKESLIVNKKLRIRIISCVSECLYILVKF
jgi:hypothetical protein